MSYTVINNGPFKPKLPAHPADLERLRKRNNPNNEPTGPFT